MKFSEYVILKEAGETQEINDIFQKAQKDIAELFKQLYAGTSDMVKSYERAGMPEQLQKSIFKSLQQIASLVKGYKPVEKITDPRGTPLSQENALINAFINDINENVSIVSDLGSKGKGVQGKPSYDFKSTLQNTYRMVMDRMSQLKDTVFDQLKTIRDTHSKVLGLRNTAGNIRNILKSPPQPFTDTTIDKAEDAMDAIMNMKNLLVGGDVRLVSKNNEKIQVDPKSAGWKKQVLSSPDRRFKVMANYGGKNVSYDVDMANVSDVNRVVDGIVSGFGINQQPPAMKPRRKNPPIGRNQSYTS